MSYILLILIFVTSLFANIKTPSDVYSYAMILKQKVEYLKKINHIKKPFPQIPPQHNKYPRHVLQKALEILHKINLYRISKGYGPIFIPPYPTRKITPNDVYEMVKRDDAEITSFINNNNYLQHLIYKKYTGKTPNDVYRLLWGISLDLDDLLGIHGYTPTDVYTLSLKLLDNVIFIRHSQNIYTMPPPPKKILNAYPNHSLYKSYSFLKKLRKSEINLWLNHPTDIPKKPHHVVTPTEVYDSIQYNLAELQRIKYRLGIERYFQIKKIKKAMSPRDVVYNLEYAKKLLPLFDVKSKLVQYPVSSLNKTPNDVYGVTMVILKKIAILKTIKGIHKKAATPPYIHGLKPIHAYQKALEDIEKALKLKVQTGFYPSKILGEPIRKITPNDVYEKAIRLDGIITLILNKLHYKSTPYIYMPYKRTYINKVPSDVYFNLWKISNQLDTLLLQGYSYNEIYKLEKKLEAKIIVLLQTLHIKHSSINKILNQKEKNYNISLDNLFNETKSLFYLIRKTKQRMNMEINNIILPNPNKITNNNIYNILRITNASINELLIYKNIDGSKIPQNIYFITYKHKTLNDIYYEITKLKNLLKLLYESKNYEN